MELFGFFQNLFDTADFPPRWQCGDWSSAHGWLHVVSDIAIWGAYTAIPIALVILARRRPGFSSNRLFRLFAAFIFSCGAVHLLEAIIFWHPIYRVAGVMKALTAVVSWATALVLIRVAPRALALSEVEAANEALRTEISRRESTERRFVESETRFRQTFESAPVGIAHVGLDGSWLRVNGSLCRILGYEREELVRLTFQDVTHPDDLDADLAQVEALIAGEIESYAMEKRYLRRDGSVVWTQLTVSTVREDGADSAYFISIIQDISDAKEHQVELERARNVAEAANRARGEFLANMSHEIRTPMSAILGHTEILLRQLEDPDDRQGVQTIKRSGEHLLGIINDILDLSRIEADRMEVVEEPCDLGRVLLDVDDLMRGRVERTAVALRVRATTDLPVDLATDPKRVRQILFNLVGNALKFTREGEVDVVAAYDADERAVRIAVRDTGIGIPEEMRERVFDPFSQGDPSRTREFGGSGLGLSISQRLAELLGGRIELTSEVGVGSTFTLVIPVAEASVSLAPFDPAQRDAAPEPAVPLADLSARVLLVDDRRDIRNVGQHFLEEAGARVETAADGALALVAVGAAEAAGDPFDVVVMDIQMPVMDGHEATRELRSRGFMAPILALTANAMREDEERALSAGCDAFLTKPIEADELIAMVARLANGPPRAGRG